jgi:predicted RNase H-like nuclease
MSMRHTRGSHLPYQSLAGVVPCPRGWLAATSKLQGITMAPEEPQVFSTFIEVLDWKPAFQVIALFAPIGLLEEPKPLGRTCDRLARGLLGPRRGAAVASAPTRPALDCATFAEAARASGGHLSPVRWRQLKRIAEVDKAIAPYWQRTVFEVHPELSFFQLNGDAPVRFPKHTERGTEERRTLLADHLPGVERVVDATVPGVSPAHLLDAAACLWTARRIISRAIARLPADPEWDGAGLRMELIR